MIHVLVDIDETMLSVPEGINAKASAIMFRRVFGNMAPKRDQLFDIIRNQATSKDNFIIIDDSIIGVKMAQQHSIPVIMVATGKATEEQLKVFTPYVFPDFGDDRWQQVVSLIGTIR